MVKLKTTANVGNALWRVSAKIGASALLWRQQCSEIKTYESTYEFKLTLVFYCVEGVHVSH